MSVRTKVLQRLAVKLTSFSESRELNISEARRSMAFMESRFRPAKRVI